MDRTKASDAFNAGSIPVGCIPYFICMIFIHDNRKPAKRVFYCLQRTEQKMSNKKNNKSKNRTVSKKNQSSNKGADVVKSVSGKLDDVKKTGKSALKKLEAKDFKILGFSALKVVLPAAACVIVLAVVISLIATRKNSDAEEASVNAEDGADEQETVALPDEPLETNAYPEINELMNRYYRALADGEMDTVSELCDEINDTQRIIFEKRSEFIESYDDLTCYTKKSMDENSYFVYVTFFVKFNGVDNKAPGLNAFYVYAKDDGSLVIDGDMEESVKAVFDLVTCQKDVIDLYKRVDVNYAEVIASDDGLKTFMDELPAQVKSSVGVALAQLEMQDSGEQGAEAQTEESAEKPAEQETQSGEPQSEEILENKTVNELVKTTDTVNVRSSDSEEADKIGRATAGTEFTRIEQRVNGWSKVIFEGKEAYIKSDYLEVVSSEAAGAVVKQVKATTNVNVRNAASQTADRIGLVEAGNTYNLLEDLGEWYRIDYKGQNGYVKSEYFE